MVVAAAHPTGASRFPFRAVLFDLDGTLIDSAPVWRSVLVDLATSHGATLPSRLLDELVGLTAETAIARVSEYAGWDQERRGKLGPEVKARVRAAYRAEVPWLPDTVALLRQLAAAGVPTALVTSSDADLVDPILAALSGHQFNVVVCAGHVTEHKPAAAPYRKAAEDLGVPPNRCLVIEDSTAGVQSALAAGCFVVALTKQPLDLPAGAACFIIDTLAGVKPADLGRLFID
jgi:HAD superfamily hydrolase (TIGR01509 family)